MKGDVASELGVIQTLKPAAYTSSQNNGANSNGAVDLAENEVFNGCMFVINVGTWTDGTFTVAIEEADDDGSGAPDTSTWSEVADADLVMGSNGEPVIDGDPDDEQVYKVGYVGQKRHVRAKVTVSGGPGTGVPLGISVVMGAPRSAKVTTGEF